MASSKPKGQVVIMIRIQPDLAAQIDAFVPLVAKAQARSARGVGRAGVIRYALAKFLEAQGAQSHEEIPTDDE
jgi:hypothetical protein